MERIHIEASTAYDVIIENNVLQHITDYIEPLKKPCPTVLVSDDNVAPLYGSLVKNQLTAAGYTVYEYVFPHGEAEKNASRLIDLVEFMAEKALTRKDYSLPWARCSGRHGGFCGGHLFTRYQLYPNAYIPVGCGGLLRRW